MTLRSDPQADCTRCHGSGIVMVSKDPDREADCVCTDAREPTPAQRIDTFARSIGIELMPWQRELATRLLAGQKVAVVGGRRGGFKTVQRVVEGARRV